MRKVIILIIIFFLTSGTSANALFQKKDYKQMFLNDAKSAAKRNNTKSAFHSYEKALYYYKKDINVIEEYAKFAEKQSYFDKAEELYQKAYILSKDSKFLFKKNLCAIKNGKLSKEQLEKLTQDKNLKPSQRNELNTALVYYFAYKNDWIAVQKTCDAIPSNAITPEVISTCIVATERKNDKKNSLKYYLRFHELYPKDSQAINKIITIAQDSNNYKLQERFLIKFVHLNPKDNGIKYRLAGFYEKNKQWAKAAKVYETLMHLGDKSEHVKNSLAFVNSQLHPKKEYFRQNQGAGKSRELTEKEKKENKLYSELKAKNYAKTLELTEELLKKYPDEQKYIILAFENSMASQNWDKSIFYADKLLEFKPDSEILKKYKGDFYAIKEDFPAAIKIYEDIINKNPKPEYNFTLANLYMANQEFDKAQNVLEPLYEQNKNNPEIVKSFLNTLLAQQKIQQAYWLIKQHRLETTKEGYSVSGDIFMMDKEYDKASKNYRNALELSPSDTILQNKLAETYRLMGYSFGPQKMYEKVLKKDPNNIEAKLGLGSIEIDRKNFQEARCLFCDILKENPDYNPAKVAITHSYLANDEKFNALDILDILPDTNETAMMKAQTYYDMNMYTDAKGFLKGVATKDAEELKQKIRKEEAITITPSYSFLIQQLADEFNLDMCRYGIHLAKNTDTNLNAFLDYNIYWYSSGNPYFLNNVTNEVRGGIQSRPTKQFEYRLDLGVKAFQFGGAMLNTDSWLKYYVNDKFNVKLGFRRNNLEQSYLSAVGEMFNGQFTGRVADNKFYIDLFYRLPNQFYSFARGSYGQMTAQNLPTNQYLEGMIGVGRLVYDDPKNKWIQRVGVDIVSYNSGYQYNLLDLYNSAGVLYGGYFSPGFFTADTLNVYLEGEIKKWRLKYGIKGFAGIQNAQQPNQTNLTWSFAPYVSYELNDHLAFNASYSYYNYADVQRHYFNVNAVIRGYKKHDKK